MKLHLSIDDCIELVTYMCGKIGMRIKEEFPFSPYSLKYVLMHGTVVDFETAPMLNYATPWSLCGIIRVDKFLWKYNETDVIFKALCLAITGLKIPELNVVITNPFFQAKNVLDAKSKEEAFVLLDLWFPGDNAKRVHEYIAKKEAERLNNEKDR